MKLLLICPKETSHKHTDPLCNYRDVVLLEIILWRIIWVFLVSCSRERTPKKNFVGAVLIPTFQRALSKAVQAFSIERSIPKLIMHSFSKVGVKHLRECVSIPVKNNITDIKIKKLPKKILVYNIAAVAFVTVGSLAPILAGSIKPELRATCITLASVINGSAAILMAIFIDPQLSIMTDDVIVAMFAERLQGMCCGHGLQ